MTTLRYDIVDVFTNQAYSGNPLAVVHGGQDLSDAQMQAIANEFGLSETTFPLPPSRRRIQPVEAFASTSSVNNSEGFFQL